LIAPSLSTSNCWQSHGANPKEFDDLRNAPKLSLLYEKAAGVYRRTGATAKANAMEARRLDLWHRWDKKLPNNTLFAGNLKPQA